MLIPYSSHGKFRPSLKGLVQQNSEGFVKETTTAGFSADSWSDSLDILTKLKGIGPATAALLLSTSDPETLPFFSDELFRWAFWEKNRAPDGIARSNIPSKNIVSLKRKLMDCETESVKEQLKLRKLPMYWVRERLI